MSKITQVVGAVNSNFFDVSNFGDGSDGDVTLGAGTTTLARDMYYNNLTIPNGSTLATANYRVFVKGTFTNNGTVSNNGTDAPAASGSSAGASASAVASGSLQQITAGAQGGAGGASTSNGSNGASVASYVGLLNKTPASGGTGGAGAGGARTGGTPTVAATVYYPLRYPSLSPLRLNVIMAGGINGGGGGGGGSGGTILVYHQTLTNQGSFDVSGGAKGLGSAAAGGGTGSPGLDGDNGASGQVQLYNAALNSWTII